MGDDDTEKKAANDASDFLALLVAAMIDAVTEGALTQLQTKLIPPGTTRERVVRVIIVPEEMKFTIGGS